MKTTYPKLFILFSSIATCLILVYCSKHLSASSKVEKQDTLKAQNSRIQKNATQNKAADKANVSYEYAQNGTITKINFGANNDLKNSKPFVVAANNPYNKLQYEKRKELYCGNNAYKVSGKVKTILPSYNPTNYNSQRDNHSSAEINELFSTDLVAASEDKNIHVVAYTLAAYSENTPIGLASSLVVIDNKGNTVKEMNNIDVNIVHTGVTTDGKYLFICYGYDDERGYVLLPGYRIYDLESNKIVIDNKAQDHSYGGDIADNLIIFSYEYFLNEKDQATMVEIYDLYTQQKFTKSFKYGEQKLLKVNRKGCKVLYKKEVKIISLENDFTKEKL